MNAVPANVNVNVLATTRLSESDVCPDQLTGKGQH
jgi:hypothetical protein